MTEKEKQQKEHCLCYLSGGVQEVLEEDCPVHGKKQGQAPHGSTEAEKNYPNSSSYAKRIDADSFPKVGGKKKKNYIACLRCGKKEEYITTYMSRLGLCVGCYEEFRKMFEMWCAMGKDDENAEKLVHMVRLPKDYGQELRPVCDAKEWKTMTGIKERVTCPDCKKIGGF